MAVTQTEAGLLSDLRFIARNDLALTAQLVALPWLTDGVTQTEAGVVSNFVYVAADDNAEPGASDFPWLTDRHRSCPACACAGLPMA